MKKTMVLLIVTLFISPLLLCVPKVQAAADWKQYHQYITAIFYYDANSIQRSGDLVQVTIWGKYTPQGLRIVAPIDSFIILGELNCRNKTFFNKRLIDYSADGSIINDLPYDPDIPPYKPHVEIFPGSMEDSLYHPICS